MKKIHARQLTLKNIHAMALKKIHTRNLITKKIPTARIFPTPPPKNFFNGPSLNRPFAASHSRGTKPPQWRVKVIIRSHASTVAPSNTL